MNDWDILDDMSPFGMDALPAWDQELEPNGEQPTGPKIDFSRIGIGIPMRPMGILSPGSFSSVRRLGYSLLPKLEGADTAEYWHKHIGGQAKRDQIDNIAALASGTMQYHPEMRANPYTKEEVEWFTLEQMVKRPITRWNKTDQKTLITEPLKLYFTKETTFTASELAVLGRAEWIMEDVELDRIAELISDQSQDEVFRIVENNGIGATLRKKVLNKVQGMTHFQHNPEYVLRLTQLLKANSIDVCPGLKGGLKKHIEGLLNTDILEAQKVIDANQELFDSMNIESSVVKGINLDAIAHLNNKSLLDVLASQDNVLSNPKVAFALANRMNVLEIDIPATLLQVATQRATVALNDKILNKDAGLVDRLGGYIGSYLPQDLWSGMSAERFGQLKRTEPIQASYYRLLRLMDLKVELKKTPKINKLLIEALEIEWTSEIAQYKTLHQAKRRSLLGDAVDMFKRTVGVKEFLPAPAELESCKRSADKGLTMMEAATAQVKDIVKNPVQYLNDMLTLAEKHPYLMVHLIQDVAYIVDQLQVGDEKNKKGYMQQLQDRLELAAQTEAAVKGYREDTDLLVAPSEEFQSKYDEMVLLARAARKASWALPTVREAAIKIWENKAAILAAGSNPIAALSAVGSVAGSSLMVAGKARAEREIRTSLSLEVKQALVGVLGALNGEGFEEIMAKQTKLEQFKLVSTAVQGPKAMFKIFARAIRSRLLSIKLAEGWGERIVKVVTYVILPTVAVVAAGTLFATVAPTMGVVMVGQSALQIIGVFAVTIPVILDRMIKAWYWKTQIKVAQAMIEDPEKKKLYRTLVTEKNHKTVEAAMQEAEAELKTARDLNKADIVRAVGGDEDRASILIEERAKRQTAAAA